MLSTTTPGPCTTVPTSQTVSGTASNPLNKNSSDTGSRNNSSTQDNPQKNVSTAMPNGQSIGLVDYHAEFASIAKSNPTGPAYWSNAVRKIAGQSSVIGFAMQGYVDDTTCADFACIAGIQGDYKEQFRKILKDSLIRCECHDQALYEAGPVIAETPIALISIPLRIESPICLNLTICFALKSISQRDIVFTAERLQSLLSQAVVHLPQLNNGRAVKQEDSRELELIQRISKYRDTREFAYSLVAAVADRYEFEKVAIGVVEQHRVQILAISGFSHFKANSPGVVDIQQAMEEAFDIKHVITCQSFDDSKFIRNGAIHQRWGNATRSVVLSVPIFADDEIVAIVSVQRNSAIRLSEPEIDGLQKLLAPFGPAIVLSRRGDRGIRDHLLARTRHAVQEVCKPKSSLGWMTRLAAIAAITLFFFGWMPYRPVTPCMIVPANMTQTMARFDMTLDQAFVDSGDYVRKGDILAVFDTRTLELEKANLIASRNQAEVDVRKALSEKDAAAAALAKAASKAIACQLDAVEDKLKHCVLKAPADGMVIDADLEMKIGQVFPQGEPVLSFAPMDQWELELQIPERLSRFIESDQYGTFAPVATPGITYPYRIQRVSGSAEVVDGKNVIVAKAIVDGVPPELRYGMKGVARTNTGWRPICWITLHRAYEFCVQLFWL